jgi:deazaflavin-dependent oxidoreductase (nitroreductase family)
MITEHPESVTPMPRYVEPDAFTRRVFNPFVSWCTRWGISLWGARVLSVPGRVSGEIRSTPVNVLTVEDRRYLVAPRGRTQWVLNVRAAGTCTLRVGRRAETVRLRELDDHDKPAVLRPYLRRWKWEVGQFFDGVGPDSTDAELLAIAPNHPVFEITSI